MNKKSRVAFNKTEFLPKIAHELRTPLHGILMVSNYLAEYWESTDNELKRSCIKDIANATSRLQDLTNNFLKSQQEIEENINCKLSPTNIVQVAEEAINNCKILLFDKETVNLSLECKTDKKVVLADQIWIKQLFLNLIHNAIKHSKAKNIKVEVDLQKKSSNNNLIVAVIDDGVGIPKNKLDSIFTPFERGLARQKSRNENQKGIGLGLSICQEIIEAHDGEIWAENNDPGKGASIKFTLPV